ncbi:MAG: hypothetical protein ACPGYV_02595 [Phycisphaeraceae bacterium]
MRPNGISIVNVAVALLIVMIAVVIFLPTIGRGRPSPIMGNSTQLRGIHLSMVTYANSNKNFFPGLGSDGLEDKQTLIWQPSEDDGEIPTMQAGLAVHQRMAILLHGEFLTPYYLISPMETDPNIKPWPERGAIQNGHFSFAMLQVPEESEGRRAEWYTTLNSRALVVSDRNTATIDRPASIHTDPGEPWAGSVLWNDNSVRYELTDTFETRYGEGEANEADRLFAAESATDALLIHAGN